jgi:hypothetical protein
MFFGCRQQIQNWAFRQWLTQGRQKGRAAAELMCVCRWQALEETRVKREEVASLRGAKKELDGANHETEKTLNMLRVRLHVWLISMAVVNTSLEGGMLRVRAENNPVA